MSKHVKYVGPSDAVEVVGLGLVKHGESVVVDADLAGRAPKGDPVDKDGSPNPEYDPGEGLLAQPDNWESASKASAKSEERGE
jgi:hypothetical protein